MPKAPDHAYHKAALAKLDKEPKVALKLLREGLRTDRKFARGHFDLARAYALTKKRREAVLALQKAIELDEELARAAMKEPAFTALRGDVDFLLVSDPDSEIAKASRALTDGDERAVVAVLRQIGRKIPTALVGAGHWGDEELLPVLSALERMDIEIPPEDHAKVMEVMIADEGRIYASLVEHALEKLREVDRGRYESRACDAFVKRVKATRGTDAWFVEIELLRCEPTLAARTLVKCLDAAPALWPDFAQTVATILDRVTGTERAALVALAEKHLRLPALEGTADARYQRAMLALPPPKPRLNEDDNDPWAGERAAVAHPHPALAIPMAKHLLIQDAREKLRPVVLAQRDRLLAFALDDALAAELRTAAREALELLGDKKTLAALSGGSTKPAGAKKSSPSARKRR